MSRKLKITLETSHYNNSLAMKPDTDGCFNVIVGATNVFNTSGAKYVHNDKVVNIFSPNGEMLKRVKQGVMKAEKGHPMPKPGMSPSDYLKRVYMIDDDNVACDILNLRLSKTPVNLGDKNTMVYPTYALIKPSGPHGETLYNSLVSDVDNTAFSVRSITVDYYVGTVLHKEFKYIVNYDWVHAPGIPIAKSSMWKAFGLESNTDVSIEITMEDIEKLSSDLSSMTSIGLESATAIVDDLKSMLKTCSGDDCIYKQWQ